MKMAWRRTLAHGMTACAIAVLLLGSQSLAQEQRQQDKRLIAERTATEKELESVAIIDRKVMIPMRDGKRMQADIYRPKDRVEEIPDHLCAHSLQL